MSNIHLKVINRLHVIYVCIWDRLFTLRQLALNVWYRSGWVSLKPGVSHTWRGSCASAREAEGLDRGLVFWCSGNETSFNYYKLNCISTRAEVKVLVSWVAAHEMKLNAVPIFHIKTIIWQKKSFKTHLFAKGQPINTDLLLCHYKPTQPSALFTSNDSEKVANN